MATVISVKCIRQNVIWTDTLPSNFALTLRVESALNLSTHTVETLEQTTDLTVLLSSSTVGLHIHLQLQGCLRKVLSITQGN